MEAKRSKKALLYALVSLTAAGCATSTDVAIAPPTKPLPVVVASSAPQLDIPGADFHVDAGDAATSAPPTVVGRAAGQPPHANDVWQRIRAGYGLAPLDSTLIARHEKWFMDNPEYMQRMMERARLYLFFIAEEVEKRKLPMEIALLPAIESAYKPYAYSRAKASGLWQFIAPTGRLYGLNMNWWYDERRDVMASTRAALDYLEKLNKDFNDWHLALAAYNAGEGKIARMRDYNRRRGQPTEYQYLKLKPETVHYVPKLIAMANIVANPEKYGVNLLSIPNEPYFTRVDAGSQIDLGVVAKLTDMSIEDLRYINPHLNRWATHPEGPHHLLIPADKEDMLLAGLNKLPHKERVQWRGHEVKRGDTLSNVARQYGVTVEALRSANGLQSNILHLGQSLMIPVSSRSLDSTYVAVAGTTKPVAAASTKTAWRSGGGIGPVIHRVRSGETLWGIARRYGVLVSQIVEWNVLKPGEILRLGQKLRIFPDGASGGPAAAIQDDTPNG